MANDNENRKQALRDLIEDCRRNGKDAMQRGDTTSALSYQQGQQVYEDELRALGG